MSLELANDLMVDPEFARVVEVTAATLAWIAVEAWHIAEARWKGRGQ